jgi:hypothetical protein
MNEQYEKELNTLRKRMEQAEEFAEKFPHFANIIISNKYTMQDNWVRLSNFYKNMPFPWGINRGYFNSNTDRNINNYEKPHDCYLWNIYINTLTLYNEHVNFGLYDIVNDVDVFFLDKANSTFYATDDQIIPLLDRLVEWYNGVSDKLKEFNKNKRINELKRELEELEG